jgi:two-component system chemotaxis response regulator CheB
VAALHSLIGGLPADLKAAVLIVMHIPVHTPTALDRILNRAGPLPVKLAEDGEALTTGVIYVAPADRHLVIESERIRLTRGPRENRVRPCIDVLFRSAALAFGPRVIGVVLTGMLDDGTAGLWAIKDRGGLTLVQCPEDAQHAGMPESALKHVVIDRTLPLSAMAQVLTQLTHEPLVTTAASRPSESLMLETKIAVEGNALKRGVMNMGEISPNSCPECHGVLVRLREGSIVRYRCHTGHAYSLKTLLSEIDEAIDASLWNAIGAIEERALVLREMEALSDRGREDAQDMAVEAECRAQRIRDLVVDKTDRNVQL